MHSRLPCFDELRDMARQRPQELERLRRRLTDQVIEAAPPGSRRRLRGLQFQIEARCRCAGTPYSACMQLTSMMQDSFERLRLALNGLPETPPASRGPRARILDFRRPAQNDANCHTS